MLAFDCSYGLYPRASTTLNLEQLGNIEDYISDNIFLSENDSPSESESSDRELSKEEVQQQISDLFSGNSVPDASGLAEIAESQGWTASRTEGGPITYRDSNGVKRITIKAGSGRTAGSEGPHVELRNAAGQRVDPSGNPVTRRRPNNHTPINYDL